MTQEEKAKAYDKALKVAKDIRNGEAAYIPDGTPVIDAIFPELKGSEDEKTKRILHSISSKMSFHLRDIFTEEEFQCFDAWSNAWLEKQGNPTDINPSEFDLRLNKLLKQFETLPKEELANSLSFYLNVVQNDGTYKPDEKQGEQKPAEYTLEQAAGIFLDALSNTPYNNKPITDAQVITKEFLKFLSDVSSYNPNALNEQKPAWSEEDEDYLKAAIWYAENPAPKVVKNAMLVEWLKNLRGRVQPQPKQEWSEEDEIRIKNILSVLDVQVCWDGATGKKGNPYQKEINWLKSLKDRYAWKPSDEQIKVCKEVYADMLSAKCLDLGTVNGELNRLEEQLKKL